MFPFRPGIKDVDEPKPGRAPSTGDTVHDHRVHAIHGSISLAIGTAHTSSSILMPWDTGSWSLIGMSLLEIPWLIGITTQCAAIRTLSPIRKPWPAPYRIEYGFKLQFSPISTEPSRVDNRPGLDLEVSANFDPPTFACIKSYARVQFRVWSNVYPSPGRPKYAQDETEPVHDSQVRNPPRRRAVRGP